MFTKISFIIACITMVANAANLYDQCGGSGGICATAAKCEDKQWAQCPSGSSCSRQSEFYYQCLPGGASVQPMPSSTSSSSSPSTSSSAAQPPASPIVPPVVDGSSQVGKTTRYWDCCKPSCAWDGKAAVSKPVTTCSAKNSPLTDANAQSGCSGGDAYMCTNQTPFVIDGQAFGFAAANIQGKSEAGWCCGCYELTFTSGPVSGKKMTVQVTNTGGDLGSNQFDLAIPGGGQGIFSGCNTQFPGFNGGNQFGGISSLKECAQLPTALQAGCEFRFGDFFQNADNPSVTFKEVSCPAVLTDLTGCKRS